MYLPPFLPADTPRLLRATRPKMATFAVLLLLASLRHLGLPLLRPAVLAACVTLTLLTSAIVITNDLVDREHDQGKGRTLATERPRAVLGFAITLWLTALLAALPLLHQHPAAAAPLLALAIGGLGYSWCRRIPLLSAVLVAASYASCPLLAATLASADHPALPLAMILPPTVAIFTFVHGRETIADLEDLAIDHGYKATLPTLLGPTAARYTMATAYTLGLLAALHTHPATLLMLPLFVHLMALTFAHTHTPDTPPPFPRMYRTVDLMTVGFVVVLWV